MFTLVGVEGVEMVVDEDLGIYLRKFFLVWLFLGVFLVLVFAGMTLGVDSRVDYGKDSSDKVFYKVSYDWDIHRQGWFKQSDVYGYSPDRIKSVEFSTDNGKSWKDSNVLGSKELGFNFSLEEGEEVQADSLTVRANPNYDDVLFPYPELTVSIEDLKNMSDGDTFSDTPRNCLEGESYPCSTYRAMTFKITGFERVGVYDEGCQSDRDNYRAVIC